VTVDIRSVILLCSNRFWEPQFTVTTIGVYFQFVTINQRGRAGELSSLCDCVSRSMAGCTERNSSVQTASLQCFCVIAKGGIFTSLWSDYRE